MMTAATLGLIVTSSLSLKDSEMIIHKWVICWQHMTYDAYFSVKVIEHPNMINESRAKVY